jgi:integrase
MASIKQTNEGTWRAFVCIDNVRKTKTFKTKTQAKEWAAFTETELRGKAKAPADYMSFGKVMERYKEEVTELKKGKRWESLRITAMMRDPIAEIMLSDLTPAHVTEWRQRRMAKVSASSVAREMTIIKHMLEVARRDWRLIQSNPAADVRKPKVSPHRSRIISDEEVGLICAALGYHQGKPCTVQHRVALSLLFALETAMRSGEICNLTRADIVGNVAEVKNTKNGSDRRVPLSQKALDILNLTDDDLFNVDARVRDTTFRKAVARAGLVDLHYHDSRHTAVSRLARVFSSKGMSVLDLARMTGHKDLRQLLIYFNVTAESIADKL